MRKYALLAAVAGTAAFASLVAPNAAKAAPGVVAAQKLTAANPAVHDVYWTWHGRRWHHRRYIARVMRGGVWVPGHYSYY